MIALPQTHNPLAQQPIQTRQAAEGECAPKIVASHERL
jgi:hypothetical protein